MAIGQPLRLPELTPPAVPTVSRTDRAALLEALEQHAGNVRAAAKALGISRPTFYSWCLRHGIDPGAYRPG